MSEKDEGLFQEVPFDPEDFHVEAAHVIVEAMAQKPKGIDLDAGSVEQLLRQCRHAHRMALSDFKRRNDPEYQVPRARPRGRRLYDYGDDAGAGLEDWPAWWKSIWGRPRANPGLFRGTNIAKPPLVQVYRLVNEWWLVTLGPPFRPDFDGIAAVPDKKNMEVMNPAARLFLLAAQDSDRRYNCDLCAKVHDVTYARLDRRTVP